MLKSAWFDGLTAVPRGLSANAALEPESAGRARGTLGGHSARSISGVMGDSAIMRSLAGRWTGARFPLHIRSPASRSLSTWWPDKGGPPPERRYD